MDRVKWNDFMEILSDDLNRSGDYLIEGFQNMVSDFISTGDVTVGLAVTAQAVPNMSVYVKKGRLYQNGQQGNLVSDSSALTIAAAHSSYARIDRVVAQYQVVEDLPETRNVMTDVVSRNITQQTVKTRVAGMVVFQVLQGVAAASPVPVSVPEGWVALAKINVPANATKIQQNNIVSEAPGLFNLLSHNHNGAGGGQKISYKNLTDTPALATKSDAEKGTDDNKVMTPLRTKQAVEKFAPLKTVNGQRPDEYGNVKIQLDYSQNWDWADGNIILDGFYSRIGSFQVVAWALTFPAGIKSLPVTFPVPFSGSPAVFTDFLSATTLTGVATSSSEWSETGCRINHDASDIVTIPCVAIGINLR